ncbi:MAG: hypothetical protein KAS32_15985 [Candidatus Peribacteraceae bacterium]|nr:hypothetical protein [Candidatus Peribacteraceae bacterium]
MEKKETFGEKITPVLVELEETMWEKDVNSPNQPPQYPTEALRASIKIFMHTIQDELWNVQEEQGVVFEDRVKQAEVLGKELKDFVFKWTQIDTHKLFDH